MRWTHLGRYALVLLLSVGLVACGDDDPTDPGNDGDQLTEAEATVMLEALVEAGGFAFGTPGGGPAAVPARVVFGPVTLEQTESCPLGGTVTINGTFSGDVDDSGFGTLDYQFIQTHSSCTASASSNSSTWTFNGSPNITIDFSYTLTETSFNLDGTQTGGIAFSGAGKSGTCAINLTYDFSGAPDGSTFSGSIQGSVCGISVSETLSIG